MPIELNATEAASYKSCLQRPVSTQEVESRKVGRPAPTNPYWLDFLAHMMEGDELWQYSSPREDWENLVGETGVAIVRDGEVVSIFFRT